MTIPEVDGVLTTQAWGEKTHTKGTALSGDTRNEDITEGDKMAGCHHSCTTCIQR